MQFVLPPQVAASQPIPTHATSIELVNPDFERAREDDASRPAGWNKAGAGDGFQLDRKVFRNGAASLRITRSEGAPLTAVAQTFPAGPLRDTVVSLRAWTRAEGADTGGALILFATDDDRKMIAFALSESSAGDGSNDWVQQQVRMLVPANAAHLQLGLRLTGAGTIWFDDVEALTWGVATTAPDALSASADKYLNDAITAIRQHALNGAKVDWPAATAQARALASGAITTADTYPAIRHVLRLLGDGHSILRTPRDNAAAARSANQSLTDTHVSVIAGRRMDRDAAQQFASKLQQSLASMDKPECGLLLDLRGNTGGNMFPMLAGLAPLFADGDVGGLATANDGSVTWRFRDGAFVASSKEHDNVTRAAQPAMRIGNGNTPVAVLLGQRTGSSGEAVAIAFVGRPNTRSFGAPTAGLTTGNRPVKLADGATLAITGSVMLDRTGKRYGGKLAPDELTDGTRVASPNGDAAVAAAIAWLDQQKACPR
jgi:C-terminal processing protease CtpA/Prc